MLRVTQVAEKRLSLVATRARFPRAQLDELVDGEVVDVPGAPRVVHAPGHTPGSCALFLEDRSLLFSGDALARTNAELVLPGHGDPWPHGVSTAVEIALQT